jgi:RNA polymerase sigma factor (sigma-70 family)
MSAVPEPDALLARFLHTEDPGALEATLSELLAAHADPVVRRVVGSRLAGRASEAEDVCSEARIELLLHLRRLKAARTAGTIVDFSAYVAALAANACHRYFRRRQRGLMPVSESGPDGAPAAESVPAVEEQPETALHRKRFVTRLWAEIQDLPRAQRLALLLHLRDRRGNSVLFLFPLCGVATFGRIAAVLEVSEDSLAALWNELPADDNAIAGLLGCERQRVINLRMSSRKRLSNRMREWQ